MGASDFIIGFFGDTPLANLVVNTSVGAMLFPNLYTNRGAAVTYEPDAFLARVERSLQFDQPTFMALHLTLAHWPYSWADSPGNEDPRAMIKGEYKNAVARVDRQFNDLVSMLNRHGALKNALVVVLSDHGEAIGLDSDHITTGDPSLGKAGRRKFFLGHGVSVLSPSQYHVVLGMRGFGEYASALPAGRVIDAPVSVEDIAPTLTQLLTKGAKDTFDGQSLVSLIQDQPAAVDAFKKRVRFTETEFNPPGIGVGFTSTSGLISAASFYRVDPETDRIEVSAPMLPRMLEKREYAAILPNKMIVALPGDQSGSYEIVSVENNPLKMERLYAPPSSQDDPDLAKLWAALRSRFPIS